MYKIKFAIRNACYPKYLQEHYFLSAEAYRLSVMEEDSTMLHINGIENAPVYCTEILMKTKYLLSFSILVGFWRDCRRASLSWTSWKAERAGCRTSFFSLERLICENADVKKHQSCSWLHAQSHIRASAEILTFNQVLPIAVVFGFFSFLFHYSSLLPLILLERKVRMFLRTENIN